jgi:Tfp pilus assembly protein FimT
MRGLESKNDLGLTRFAASGFSSLELIIVISIALVIVMLWVPSLSKTQAIYRVTGDARSLAEDLTLAKMRAGANFTQERLNLNTTTNTYALEQFDKTASPPAWVSDGGSRYLNAGVTFGYGSISTPAGSQSTLAQSTLITFNSRGIPVNGSNQPTADDALYIHNSSGYYAVSVALSGRIQIWKYVTSAWVLQ